ncbi:hypothetical protein [Brumimicrobium aurantiacum]|uniref:DUF1499 domain-containing protein n=1 Tax=Brumimicrobium aurantiacum TaxID=1737063 RepID=A0A3E1EYV6_9FLAO|nr:hypothetical protein [Brumimicrobium aurantiacum]RFC54745.1 hypothetical protein DXU93_07100 [Brumimicrobium aurantiacum]
MMAALAKFGWIIPIIVILAMLAYKVWTKKELALTSKYQDILSISGDLSLNLKIINEALQNARFRKVMLDEFDHRFYAQTRYSMSSFSENIELKYQQKGESTVISFKSICALPTQVYDWGKNKRNFKRFNKELERLMKKEN